MRWKPDADEIVRFIDELADEWSGDVRSWWPHYLFHVTDVRNAASVLASGRLLSRQRVKQLGLMQTDNASSSHIASTKQDVLDCVRLYFRPRTKTFKLNEGIRPTAERYRDAHCPVPVAFLLDSRMILGSEGVRFSDGNLARHDPWIASDARSLRRLPFDFVYRDPALGREPTLDTYRKEDRDAIKNYRHSEVIVPGELPLKDVLHYVFVRSPAERETLLSLLAARIEHVPQSLAAMIQVDATGSGRTSALFFKEHSFVVDVSTVDDYLWIEFNPLTTSPGPFQATFQFIDRVTEQPVFYEEESFQANRPVHRPIPRQLRANVFQFRLLLDGCLAYQTEFSPSY
jgi:hypothetical protein